MKTSYGIYMVISLLSLSSCGIMSLSLVPHKEYSTSSISGTTMNAQSVPSTASTHQFEGESCSCNEKSVQCEECEVIPVSGAMRDNRWGYYYDQTEKKCREVIYSSGGIPAPFGTMTECLECCCKNHLIK